MKKIRSTKYPLLRHLAAAQIMTFTLLAVVVAAVVTAIVKSQSIAYESEVKQLVRPKIEIEQERLRSWATLGLTDAVKMEVERLKSELPVREIQVLKRSQLRQSDVRNVVIIPEHDDGASEYVVLVDVGVPNRFKNVMTDPYGFAGWVVSALAFLGMVLYSNRFVRREIYDPIQKLNKALAEVDDARELSITTIEARGEIKAFIAAMGDLYSKARQADTYAAIAQTTQMLAHDCRRPFSLLYAGVSLLEQAKTPENIESVLERLIPEMNRAMASVNGMINDILEIGASNAVSQSESISVTQITANAVHDVFTLIRSADVNLHREMPNNLWIRGDQQKIQRVLLNILNNAAQAMQGRGNIWIKGHRYGDHVEISIANDQSYIDQKDAEKIFDAFYSKGKKGGTGLGLAIAKKIVKAHGGTISCNSRKDDTFPEGYVQFVFTLPADTRTDVELEVAWPCHTSQIVSRLQDTGDSLRSNHELDVPAIAQRIVKQSEKIGRPISVLIIDDESVLRESIAMTLTSDPTIAKHLEVFSVCNAADALAEMSQKPIDLMITDIDLGGGSLNGFQLIAAVRSKSHLERPFICVVSNRLDASDSRNAIQIGADCYIPKPLMPAQLFKVVLQAASALAPRDNTTANSPSLPHVLILDDNAFLLDAWANALKDSAITHTCESIWELEKILEDREFFANIEFIVLDYHFTNSALTGFDAARQIRDRYPNLKIFLSSDATIPSPLPGCITKVIPKTPTCLSKVLKA